MAKHAGTTISSNPLQDERCEMIDILCDRVYRSDDVFHGWMMTLSPLSILPSPFFFLE
jgi:hypothetical protein